MSRQAAPWIGERAAALTTYAGATTAEHFGDPAAEWKAADSGIALFDVSYRRTIAATGDERAEFLQGQLSQNVAHMTSGAGCAALALNAQGRVQSVLDVYARPEHFELCVDGDLVDATVARLQQFLIADDVEFECDPPRAAIGLAGPGAASLLDRMGLQVPAAAAGWWSTEAEFEGVCLRLRGRGHLRVAWIEIVPEQDTAGLWRQLCTDGAVPAGASTYEVLRIESGTARYGVDVDDSRIAMEARLEWAIHFSKGCYVGQEVIERAVSRGRLNRELSLLAVSDRVAVGDRIAGGGEKDTVTSICRSPRLGTVCLAYVDRSLSATGTRLEITSRDETAEARVLEWPRPRVLVGR